MAWLLFPNKIVPKPAQVQYKIPMPSKLMEWESQNLANFKLQSIDVRFSQRRLKYLISAALKSIQED